MSVTESPLSTAIYDALGEPTEDLNSNLQGCSNEFCNGCTVGVYLTTNEDDTETTWRKLSSLPRSAHRCHIGFSGLHNFDIMAARSSEYGLICDFNPNNKKFMDAVISAVQLENSRERFIEKLEKVIKCIHEINPHFFSVNVSEEDSNDDAILEWGNPAIDFKKQTTKPTSWLYNDERFKHIQDMAKAGRITAITEDIRHTGTFAHIAELYKKNGVIIDSLYVSNINRYMKSKEDQDAYTNTIFTLLQSDNPILIDCPIVKNASGQNVKFLSQRVTPLALDVFSHNKNQLFITKNSSQNALCTIL